MQYTQGYELPQRCGGRLQLGHYPLRMPSPDNMVPVSKPFLYILGNYNMDRFRALILAVPPVPVTRPVWEIYGQTKAELSKKGKTVPDIDLLIASTSKFYDLVLVANDRHIKNLPDSFVRENWSTI